MNIITNKWVYRTKLNSNDSLGKHKARLVGRGFQQTACIDYFDTFSPVSKHSTIRFLLTLTVSLGWPIQKIDVNNDFLNGILNKTLYISQPIGFVDSNS